MAMTRAALVHDNVVVNIIAIDREGCEQDMARYKKQLAEYEIKKSEYDEWQKDLDGTYRKKKDFIGDRLEYEAIVEDLKYLNSRHLRPPKMPRPPKGHYEPPKDHILIDLEDIQPCGIGWIYKDGGFDNPDTPEPEHTREGVLSRFLGGNK